MNIAIRGHVGRQWRLVLCGVLYAGLSVIVWSEDQPPEIGPDVVILRELENQYEAVPFDHKSHAQMAQMWNGCVTCHHHSPNPVMPSDANTVIAIENKTQAASVQIPACQSCHPKTPDEADIHMPSLKGAYHRQCLNCHQEWMHENACGICHLPKEGHPVVQTDPTPGDIIGRMHPPIPEPEIKVYKTRFTPADGNNVLFRHKEHTVTFGITCAHCHHRDNCADCHDKIGQTIARKPLRPGLTWEASHGPCLSCHSRVQHCRHCHYQDDQTTPPAFNHMATGQGLDEDHETLQCRQCHSDPTFSNTPNCGTADCHENRTIDYPTDLPGPLVRTMVPIEMGVSEAATEPMRETEAAVDRAEP